MSSDIDIITDAAAGEDAGAVRPFPWTRTFAWSVRRELWEHRAIYLAPSVVAAFVTLVHFLATLTTAGQRAATLADPARRGDFMVHYDAVAGAIVVTALLVGVLYALGALHGERRDRSIMFWKSLPISDRTAVLAKAAVPMLVLPLLSFALVAASSSAMILLQSFVWSLQGFDARELWERVDLPFLWLSLLYGLPFMALWYAPVYAWILLVSAWAPRWPFMWAIAPFAAAFIVQHTMLHHTVGHWAMEKRLGGGVIEPFSIGGTGSVWIQRLSDLEPLRLYTLPGLWIGVALAALFLAGAIHMRRSRGPL